MLEGLGYNFLMCVSSLLKPGIKQFSVMMSQPRSPLRLAVQGSDLRRCVVEYPLVLTLKNGAHLRLKQRCSLAAVLWKSKIPHDGCLNYFLCFCVHIFYSMFSCFPFCFLAVCRGICCLEKVFTPDDLLWFHHIMNTNFIRFIFCSLKQSSAYWWNRRRVMDGFQLFINFTGLLGICQHPLL